MTKWMSAVNGFCYKMQSNQRLRFAQKGFFTFWSCLSLWVLWTYGCLGKRAHNYKINKTLLTQKDKVQAFAFRSLASVFQSQASAFKS